LPLHSRAPSSDVSKYPTPPASPIELPHRLQANFRIAHIGNEPRYVAQANDPVPGISRVRFPFVRGAAPRGFSSTVCAFRERACPGSPSRLSRWRWLPRFACDRSGADYRRASDSAVVGSSLSIVNGLQASHPSTTSSGNSLAFADSLGKCVASTLPISSIAAVNAWLNFWF
jgi:hypothetical protein